MEKDSDDFKLSVVKDYLEGSMGFYSLVKKYNIPDKKRSKKHSILNLGSLLYINFSRIVLLMFTLLKFY